MKGEWTMVRFKLFLVLFVIFICFQGGGSIRSAYAAEYYDMNVGDTLTLKPYSTSDKVLAGYSWVSNSPFDVEVVSYTSSSCKIRAVNNPGVNVVVNFNYYYYVTSGNYTYQAKGSDAFIITVNDIEAEDISLVPSAVVTEGEYITLEPVLTPSDATSKISWYSGDVITATVDENGVVRGNEPGTAIITAYTDNGLSAQCSVTVRAAKLSLSKASPQNGAVNVSTDTDITLNFNTVLYEGPGFGNIILKNNNTGENTDITMSINDKELKIVPADEFAGGHSYSVMIPSNAIVNKSGESMTAEVSVSFTTRPMSLVSVSPGDGEGNVNTDCRIIAVFDTVISEGPDFKSISLCDREGNNIDFICAIEENKLTVIPAETLSYNKEYCLIIPVNAIANAYGIGNNTKYESSFITRMSEYVPDVYNKLIGGSDYESITAIENVDGGYIAVGSGGEAGFGKGIWKNSQPRGGSDAVIYRLDENYNVIWCRNFGGSDYEVFNGVAATDDGYVAVGYANMGSFRNGDLLNVGTRVKYDYEYDAIIVKFDLEGNVLWVKSYYGNYNFMQYNDVAADEDGYLYVAGRRNGNIIGGYGLAVKYSPAGVKMWEKSVGTESKYVDAENSLEDVIINGTSYIFAGENNRKPFIISYTNTGINKDTVYLSSKTSVSDRIYSIAKTYDGYVAAGRCDEGDFGSNIYSSLTGYGEYDGIIIGLDNSFNVKWVQNFGGSGNDALLGVVFNNGEIIASGYEYNNGSNKALAVGVSENGEPQWKKVYEGDSSLNDIVNNNGIVTAAGYTYGAGTGELDNVSGYGSGDVLFARFGDAPVNPMGDVNNDGCADNTDAALILRHISEISAMGKEELAPADVNLDGYINMTDVVNILRNMEYVQ